MTTMMIAVLLLVAATGTGVVLTRDVKHQPVGVSAFGLMLAIMFFIFQAPDVALSQIVIGTIGLPLMILLTLAILRRDSDDQQAKDDPIREHT